MVRRCFRSIARPATSEVERRERSRTLHQDDLKAYLANYNDGHEEAIAYQVINGKNGMPAFGPKLSDADIADVAA